MVVENFISYMGIMSRGIHIYANWKMHKICSSAKHFVEHFMPLVDTEEPGIGLAVPYTQIQIVSETVGDAKISVGAQNVSEYSSGAYTGEISTQMLFDVGATFTLVGHSERRHIFHESDEEINAKLRHAKDDAMRVVLCVGETEEQRKEGKTEEAIDRQLKSALNISSPYGLIIAYEPVWAIGTGEVATPEIANAAHKLIRDFLTERFSADEADSIPIIYGGSVKPENTKSLIDMPEIDGFLVGGASLAPKPFAEIVNIARNNGT